jgi:hypothetical protein
MFISTEVNRRYFWASNDPIFVLTVDMVGLAPSGMSIGRFSPDDAGRTVLEHGGRQRRMEQERCRPGGHDECVADQELGDLRRIFAIAKRQELPQMPGRFFLHAADFAGSNAAKGQSKMNTRPAGPGRVHILP